MTEDDVEVIEKTELYRGHVLLERYRLRHKLFAGGWSGSFTRELMHRGHAAGILLFDPGRDEVVLVEQFRIGAYVGGRQPWQIELVCGVIDEGEAPEEVARREAMEEAGCQARDIRHVCDMVTSPGLLTESVALYCARADTSQVGGIHGLDGEHEDIRAFALSLDEALAWIGSGRILHGPTIIALQWLALNRDAITSGWA